MPKISADSVNEHVKQQESAVIEAAVRLFAQQGISNVSLGDIAKEVGLARNSLYRYFPDTAHILGTWFREAIKPLIERSDAIAGEDATAEDRLRRWVDAQFEHLTHPDNAAMLIASNEIPSLPDDVRADIGAGHRKLFGSLTTILSDSFADQVGPPGQTGRNVGITVMLIAALIRSAAEQIRAGADLHAVRRELERATIAVFSG